MCEGDRMRLRAFGSAGALPAVTLLCLTVCAPAAPPGDEAPAPPADDPRVTPVVRAYRRARPAVVNISSRKVVTRRGLFGPDPFEDIFPSPFPRRVPVQSLGSGFVLHPAGYIVTNAHVVRRAEQVTVTLQDNIKLPARVISAERTLDLAVLKVDPPDGRELPHLPLGRSDDLMVGETVIAIGNPLGYANSLTTGVISATNRTLNFGRGVEIGGLIQTDAPINPGNSGGPLLNIKGELIGINTAIRADAQNIGFAIPVDSLADELPRLLDFERLNRVILGAAVAQQRRSGQARVVVTQVRPDTPAAGKLREGDQIVALDDVPVRQIPDYVCPLVRAEPGQTVAFTVLREGRRQTVRVALAAKPHPDGKKLAQRWLGLTLRKLTPALARQLGLAVEEGLLVVGVEQGGPADRLGVRLKDVFFQVGRLYVKDLETLGRVLEDVQPGERLHVGLVRGCVRAWATIQARKEAPPAEEPAKGAPNDANNSTNKNGRE